jgi:outer membrane lipoprotein-sorting protein
MKRNKQGGTTQPHIWIITLFVSTAVLVSTTLAKGPTAKQIIEKIAKYYDLISDYTADVEVMVDGPTIHIPGVSAKIYYKKPDKLKVESKEGFALLPKQGIIIGNPAKDMVNAHNITLAGIKTCMGYKCYVIKGTIRQKAGNIDYTLWVDNKYLLIRQMHTHSDNGDVAKVNMWYAQVEKKYWLPIKTTVEISNARLASSQANDGIKSEQPTKITVNFANYRVNTGLKDTLFQKQERSMQN